MNGDPTSPYPARAPGARSPGTRPAPPAPTGDEQWYYLARRLNAIHTTLLVIAATLALGVLATITVAVT